MILLDIQILPIFSDNYVFVITRSSSKTCVVVDPGDAAPVQEFLEKQGLTLEAILVTHHHPDHIGGVMQLKEKWKIPVFASLKNKIQIPFASDFVIEGQTIQLLAGDLNLETLELPGHTLGHVAFFEPQKKWLFSGDVVFGLGCGRIFEGTYAQGYASLQRIKNLPDETLVYCTHEYTESNLRFCKNILQSGPELNFYEKLLLEKRNANLPSVPLTLGIEKQVNPFLTAENLERFTFLRDKLGTAP